MVEEVWSKIPGKDYEASNLGRVRSVDRWRRANARGGLRFWPGKVLSPSIDDKGYPTVTLGKRGQHRVHCLVMLAFVGPTPKGKEVCHRDGKHDNPALDNLYHGTRKQNIEDAVRHGTAWWLNGAKNSEQAGLS
jgi:hypothetical protein